MAERYFKRILDHLADQRYESKHTRELAKDLQIPGDELEDFRRAVAELEAKGQIVLSSSSEVVLPPPGKEVTGTFRLHERGFGFLVPDEALAYGDLFVPPGDNNGALTGDRVRAAVTHMRGRGKSGDRSPYIAKIVEILQRSDNKYVGNLTRKGKLWIVEVDSRMLHQPIIVRDPGAKDAGEGDKVCVELISYPEHRDELPEGVITEVLGEKGDPSVETVGVMRAFGLKEGFDDAVLSDARQAAQSFDDDAIPAERVDLTGLFICTIDPPDARDFDDAISLEKLDPSQKDGAVYELGVHIADVAHFVQTGTALDEEAYDRGNSTYLPRRVIPMLPELLSNGVCSLQEGVNRFVKSAFVRYDDKGNVVGERFTRSVIRSARRLTYIEAQALIDGDIRTALKHSKSQGKYPDALAEQLRLMHELATKIRQRRLEAGMIVLGLPEVELVYDEAGHVIDAAPEDNAFTHTIIEMFMVEANEATARLFHSLSLPMIRRIHPDPDAHDVGDLRQFARVAGFNIPARPSRRELQALLDAVRGKPAQHAVHIAVLRTLSKAEYSPHLIGHFALASEHYTHFTSPIRRYPDLIVHRALEAYFDAHPQHADHRLPGGGRKKALADKIARDKRVPDEPRLREMGRHCSATERNSESAERELRKYLVLALLAEHVGDDFEGTVTGVSSGGAFVQIDRYLVDGFVKTADLPAGGRDTWRLNRTTGALVAQRSGKTITIGDRFKVRIAQVNPEARQMELAILDQLRTAKPTHHRQPKGARQGHQQSMSLKRQRKVDVRKEAKGKDEGKGQGRRKRRK